METNKGNDANIQHTKPITKIPVPVPPLPLIPKSLIDKKVERPPLKTIQSSNENPAASSSQPTRTENKVRRNIKKQKVNLCNFPYVTRRDKATQNTQSVKDEHHDFLDDKINPKKLLEKDVAKIKQTTNFQFDEAKHKEPLDDVHSIHDVAFIISDDEEENIVDNETNKTEDEKKIRPEQIRPKAVTPEASIAVHKAVKNIKKSLKRPHSRELQGLVATVKKETKPEYDNVKRRLTYSYYLENTLQSPDHWQKVYTECLQQDFTSDIFDNLLISETKPLGIPNIGSITRACVINWLFKINGPNGQPAVIQSACWYFDSFLAKEQVPLEKIQVFAAACYWLATKINGPMLSAKKIVLSAGNAFSIKKLIAAEWTVVNVLNFPRQPIVPHEYISYLAWWCDSDHPGEIEVAATFLCMAGMQVDKSLCDEFPSVIAAAAVRNALMLLNKSGLQERLLLCPAYQTAVNKHSSLQVPFILRRAVLTVNSPVYEFHALVDHYSIPPYCIAQKILIAVANFADIDNKKDHRKDSISFKL